MAHPHFGNKPSTPSIILVLLFGVCFGLNAVSGSFDSILDDVSTCSDMCENTYTMHTYPENDNLIACQRGCRLLCILDFADEDMMDLNATLKSCKSACNEAYSTDENADYACSIGCKSQVPYIMQQREKYKELEPVIHMLTPLLAMKNMYREMLDNAHGMIMSSWSVFLQSDNGDVYVFESEPRVDSFTLQPQYSNPDQPLEVDAVVDTSSLYDNSYGSGSDWLSCVSYRSGLPEWLISLILFLSSASMIWLCFASCSTAKPQRVITPKKSYYYLDSDWEDLMKKYPVYVAETCDESSMAEPLPFKVDIANQKTSI